MNTKQKLIHQFILNKLTNNQLYDYLNDGKVDKLKSKVDQIRKERGDLRGIDHLGIVLNKELNELSDIVVDTVEQDLFDFFFSVDPELNYYKKIGLASGKDAYSVWESIVKNDFYSKYIDRKLFEIENVLEHQIISIRRDQKSVKILLQFGLSTTRKRHQEKLFMVSVKIDLENMVLSFGYKQAAFTNLQNEYKIRRDKMIEQIELLIKKMGLPVYIMEYEEIPVQRALFKIFSEEVARTNELIEKEIKSQISDGSDPIKEIRESIYDFLSKTMLLNNPEEFVDKSLSIKFQDFAKNMNKSKFIKNGGYIFGFGFADRKVTKSTNKSERKNPVYESKIYWSLKDIIFEYKEISSLALYWKFDLDDFGRDVKGSPVVGNISFTEVEYTSTSGKLSIHHFVNSENMIISSVVAKEKERKQEYALYRIDKYLRNEFDSKS